MSAFSLERQRAFVKALFPVTHGIANELTLRNKTGELAIKITIAIRGKYGYLPSWTYLLKIYRKRSQFASKSIICNDAFPLFCEVHLKGQPVPPPPDATSRPPRERSLRQPLELVGQGREALEEQLLPGEKVSSHRLAEGGFPS
jgi:hypothetical protein